MSSKNMTKRRTSSSNFNKDDGYNRKKYRDNPKNKERKRSTQSDREIHKCSDYARDSESRNSSSEDPEKDDKNVYFTKYKHELNKIFLANPNLIHDVGDFWKFVEKYESVKKQSSNSNESVINGTLNSIGVPEKYHNSHCLNFKLGSSLEKFVQIFEEKQLHKLLPQFKNVMILYLDFKQKEKFNKLRKLKDMQANLPVAQYKEEIIETIKNEKVVIIAGDTGCGKSTQIPQYLYEAGFQKIGNLMLR